MGFADKTSRTEGPEGRRAAALLGPIGLWSFQFDGLHAPEAAAAARAIERLGLPALWIGEGSSSKDALAHAGLLLSFTERLVVCTGIANMWARDPVAARGGAKLLADAYPGRFVLGLGVSHPESLPRRGHEFDRPLERARAYLEAMRTAKYAGPEPDEPPPILLAALGRRMLRLAAAEAAGAHTYFVPVDHTAFARETLGPAPVLAVEAAVVLETDPATAREVARGHMGRYMRLRNYRENLLRHGFAEEDLEDGGSDHLTDALVAWGEPEAVAERVRAHLEAGADHVAVQVLPRNRGFPLDDIAAVAAALL
jgi:probable F420-dependent oxidoreductase